MDDAWDLNTGEVPRMPASQREAILISYVMRYDGRAARELMRVLPLSYEEARRLCAGVEAARDRANGWRVTARDRAAGSDFPAAVTRVVCSTDGGAAAEGLGLRPCRGPLHNGALVPFTAFGMVRGMLKAQCRACFAERARTTERAQRSAYQKRYRQTYLPRDTCSHCGRPRTGSRWSAWCLACRRAYRKGRKGSG